MIIYHKKGKRIFSIVIRVYNGLSDLSESQRIWPFRENLSEFDVLSQRLSEFEKTAVNALLISACRRRQPGIIQFFLMKFFGQPTHACSHGSLVFPAVADRWTSRNAEQFALLPTTWHLVHRLKYLKQRSHGYYVYLCKRDTALMHPVPW